MQSRVVMCVDFDYFFAQCEEVRNPSLRDKPLVVCVYSGRSKDSGAVSTANYIARGYDVKSGMPIFLAKRKLQKVESTFLPVDREFYEEISQKTMAILRRNADLFEQAGIDEAYLDVSQKISSSFEEARGLAQRIKSEVKNEQNLTCSIGIGPNKLIAKIAVDAHKPDGLTIVSPEQVQSFLSPLPAGRLIGVGTKTEQKMQTLEIKTIGDLAKYDVQRLVETFGKSLGTYYHEASIGVDKQPVQERSEAESMSRISTLKEDTLNLNVILEVTNRLCEEIHARLQERGLSFKSVGIVAILKDMSIHNRSKTLENPTNELATIKQISKELLEKFLGESKLEARRMGVKVSNFVRKQERQRQITDFSSDLV